MSTIIFSEVASLFGNRAHDPKHRFKPACLLRTETAGSLSALSRCRRRLFSFAGMRGRSKIQSAGNEPEAFPQHPSYPGKEDGSARSVTRHVVGRFFRP